MSDTNVFTCNANEVISLKASTSYNNIIFGFDAEVLKLDKDGFVYKGERINDAGEAHRLFIRAMNRGLTVPDIEVDEHNPCTHLTGHVTPSDYSVSGTTTQEASK